MFDYGDDPKKIVNYCRYIQREMKEVDSNNSTRVEIDTASIEYEGRHFDSLKQFAEEYGLNYSKTIYYYNMDYAPDEIIQYCRKEKKRKHRNALLNIRERYIRQNANLQKCRASLIRD